MVRKLKEDLRNGGPVQLYKTLIGTLMAILLSVIAWNVNDFKRDMRDGRSERDANSKAIVAFNENQSTLITKVKKHEDKFELLYQCVQKNKEKIILLENGGIHIRKGVIK